MIRRLSRPAAAFGLVAFGALAACSAAADTATDLSGPARDALRAEIRAYLLDNPDVIMEAIQVLEQRRRDATAEAEASLVSAIAEDLRNDGYSYVAGNPDGDVTVVEFLDYNCGYCKKAHEDVKALIRMDPNVRLVIKEFPILGPSSRTAAEVAMASMMQDGGDSYLEFNDLLMKNRGQLTEEGIYALADRAGLDVDALRRDAADPAIAANLKKTYELAQKLRIEGTPTFVIGDTVVRGFVPLKDLQDSIKAERASKG
ncbi:MAG: protein-disulfide isomerase [Paracoccaceae bacterium]|jgi:protein-disulfide isomerase